MAARAGNQRDHLLDQLVRREHDVGSAIHVGVHVETGDLRAALTYDRGLGILTATTQAQYAAASTRARLTCP